MTNPFSFSSWRHGFIVCSVAAMLGGCAVVDHYGTRSVIYNQQASQSKSSSILLNIMRAAYREPLQFTDISTVTGTASASATLGTSNPFQYGGPKFNTPEFLTFTSSGTMSGGPQFNVANLNTQEFYRGIQSPLETEVLANYAVSGIPLKLLLQLFISEIEIDNTQQNKKYVIHNSAFNTASYNNFVVAIDRLVRNGLSLEPQSTTDPVGPVLSAEKASDPKLLAGIVQAAASGSGGTLLDLQQAKIEGRKSKNLFQLSKSSKKWRFCFKTQAVQPYPDDAFTVSKLKEDATYKRPVALSFSNGVPDVVVYVDKAHTCGQGISEGIRTKAAVNLYITPRSVEEIFLFLGEMVRAELSLDGRGEGVFEDPNGGPTYKFKANDPLQSPRRLFHVDRGAGAVMADLSGENFSIRADPSGDDGSGQVLQILTDLLALESSAKSLPAPNVISVIQ